MKKRFLLITIVFMILLLAGFGIHYLLSLRKVSFVFEGGTEKITIYNSDKKNVKELSSNSHTFLREGSYYFVPYGANLSSDTIEFSVSNSDKTIVVHPSFTDEYLADELQKEIGAIETSISLKYPSLYNNYTLSQGALYKQGDWFGGLLKPKVSDIRDEKDPYRIILHKKDGGWQVIRRPEYILSASRYEEVPLDVLRAINSIVGAPDS